MKYFLAFLLLLSTHTTFAQKTTAAKENAFTKRPLTFVENKGQVTDQYGKPRSDIQYKIGSAGMSIFVGNGQLHYQWSKADKKIKLPNKFPHTYSEKPDPTPTPYTMYRLDMVLDGANPHAQVIAEDKQAYYENYHTTALHSDDSPARTYNKITYKNIYPHIDWVLYIKDNKLEYDFIINPGGNANDIKIKYNGATDITNTNENIKITTPMGDISEHNLYAYEQNTGKPIIAKFICHNDTIGFSLPMTHNSQLTPLIIDPMLAWGTYFGGDGEDEAMGVTCDVFGGVYITGYTSSISNIATAGSYQTVFGGFEDVFLAKFNNADGTIQWATYYGGSSQDEGYAVACDKAGNSYITGFTISTNNIATSGAHQTVYQGNWDAFLAKFNSTGELQWSTYYGGSKMDVGAGLVCDAANNIYMAGTTASISAIATAGSFQDTIGGQDSTNNAFIAKFNSSGLLVWGTYFGGASYGCGALACACDNKCNIVITGNVEGDNIYTTPGCYQDTNMGGGEDCFIAKFDSACNLKWSTYYGGDSGQIAVGVACDDSLNVCITGVTYSTGGIATPGAYQTVYGGGYNDAFLAKFNDTGALQWATYYGGMNDDEGTGIACDNSGNIFITGYTNSTDNIATPGGLYDSYMGGLDDAYLAKFSSSGSRLWATYYGGSSGDAAYNVACDNANNIYMTGGTASTNYIATPGTYQSVFADSTDAFLVKFDTAVTSVKQINQHGNNISVFPTPNNGSFTVNGSFTSESAPVAIEITTLSGQEMYHTTTLLQNGLLNKQINLKNSPNGDYLVTISTPCENKTIKITILH